MDEYLCGLCFKKKHLVHHFNSELAEENDEDCGEDLQIETYWDCFKYCTQLDIQLESIVSQWICVQCACELKVVLKFFQKVKTIQKFLQGLANATDMDETFEHNVENNLFLEDAHYSTPVEHDKNIDDIPLKSEEYYEEYVVESVPNDQMKAEEADSTDNQESTNVKDFSKMNIEDKYREKTEYPSHIATEGGTADCQNEQELSSEGNGPNEVSYLCQICNKTFSSLRAYKSHAKVHKPTTSEEDQQNTVNSNSSSFESSNCQQDISSENMESTNKEKLFSCSVCSRSFTKIRAYNAHVRIHKTDKIRSTTCHICSKTLCSAHSLKLHLESHKTDKKLFNCTECDKVYTTKASLNHHKRSHTNEVPLVCPDCGKQFYRPSDFKIHRRFHTKDFPYICEVCGKRYGIKSHLTSHMWKHQNLKVKCQICDKLFSSGKALSDHMAFHTNKLYHCYICEKNYPSKAKYKTHLLTSHGLEFSPEDDHIPGHNKFGVPMNRQKLTLVKIEEQASEVFTENENIQ